MANNRMYLVHRPTGRAFPLAKRMGWGWYPETAGEESFQDRFTAFLDEVAQFDQDEFLLAMEDASDAIFVFEARLDLDENGKLVAPRVKANWDADQEEERELKARDERNRERARRDAAVTAEAFKSVPVTKV